MTLFPLCVCMLHRKKILTLYVHLEHGVRSFVIVNEKL